MSILSEEFEERMPTLEDFEKAIHGKLPLDHAPSTCHFAAKAAFELLQGRFDESVANCYRCHTGPENGWLGGPDAEDRYAHPECVMVDD